MNYRDPFLSPRAGDRFRETDGRTFHVVELTHREPRTVRLQDDDGTVEVVQLDEFRRRVTGCAYLPAQG